MRVWCTVTAEEWRREEKITHKSKEQSKVTAMKMKESSCKMQYDDNENEYETKEWGW